MKKLFLLLYFFLNSGLIFGQQIQSPILFIYDASGSMWGQMEGKTKKELALNVLTSAVSNLPIDQQVGLIAYGHRRKGDCDDIEYLVNLENQSKEVITESVKTINALGRTPLARSAHMAIQSLKENKTKATIILITDGIESCDGDLCKLVSEAKVNGIDFKLHIVGLGLKNEDDSQLRCAAKAGGGNYFSVDETKDFEDVLDEATHQTVDKPDGNFSVYASKNGKPVDAWVKPQDKNLRGARTYRDTAFIFLPKGKHEIEIKALEDADIPPTIISVEISNDKLVHRNIDFTAGVLEVNATINQEPSDAIVKVYHPTTGKLVSNTRTYGRTKQMEVPPGNYNLTFQSLNLEGIDIIKEIYDVEVKAGATSTLQQNFEKGTVLVGVQSKSGELIDATVNFYEKNTNKNVAAGRTYTSVSSNPKKFDVNPGTYTVKIVTLGAHKGHSDSFNITVKTGETVEKTQTY